MTHWTPNISDSLLISTYLLSLIKCLELIRAQISYKKLCSTYEINQIERQFHGGKFIAQTFHLQKKHSTDYYVCTWEMILGQKKNYIKPNQIGITNDRQSVKNEDIKHHLLTTGN